MVGTARRRLDRTGCSPGRNRSVLMVTAAVCAATGNLDAPDSSPAAGTFGFRLTVRQQPVVGPAVCTDPSVDRRPQDLPEGIVKLFLLSVTEILGRPLGVNADLEEYFVAVDVADAGHGLLVHEQALDRTAALVQQLQKNIPVERLAQGIRSEPLALDEPLMVLGPADPAEFASTVVSELVAVGKLHSQFQVGRGFFFLFVISEKAGHAEMQNQAAAAVGEA